MLKGRKSLLAIFFVAALFVIGAIAGISFAQKSAVPKQQDKLALGEDQVKQLLLLMDTDKNGKITKQEWMKFMEAEFDRLDKEKNGQLDAKEIEQSRIRVSTVVAPVGK